MFHNNNNKYFFPYFCTAYMKHEPPKNPIRSIFWSHSKKTTINIYINLKTNQNEKNKTL